MTLARGTGWRHNQPLLWTGPRRVRMLSYSSARLARRVAGHRAFSVIPPMRNSADDFIRAHWDDAGDCIRWPDGEDERTDLGQTLLGIGGVNALDEWCDIARDLVRGPAPGQPDSRDVGDDAQLRAVLTTLTEAQKAAVLRLVHKTCVGTMFSFFTLLDQYPFGNLKLTLAGTNADGGFDEDDPVQIAPGNYELHTLWLQSVKDFSSSRDAADERPAG